MEVPKARVSKLPTLADRLLTELTDRVSKKLSEVVGKKFRMIQKVVEFPVQSLLQMYEHGEIYVDPDMKREYSWSIYKASRFIESVINGYYIPPIALVDRGRGRLQLIDGFHRLETLRRFVNNEFALKGVSREFDGKRFKSLPASLQHALLTRTLPVNITTISKEDPTLSQEELDRYVGMLVFEQFRRINLGSVPLTVYQVIFCGLDEPTIKIVKEVAEHYKPLLEPMRPSEIRNLYDKSLVFNLALCLHVGKLINLSASGKIRGADKIVNFIFLDDKEKLAKIKTRLVELAKLAQEVGLKRDYFVPRRIVEIAQGTTKLEAYAKTQTKVNRVLFLTEMWALHELEQKLGRERLVKSGDKIRDTVVRFFSRIDAIKPLLSKIVRQGSQTDLETLYSEFKRELEKALGA